MKIKESPDLIKLNELLKVEIPLYRAKKIDSDEYVIGYIYQPTHFITDGLKLICYSSYDTFSVDVTTLSIHFSSMIDSKKNKIFASLSEDGKGGDILIEPMFEKKQIICKINASGYVNKHIKALYSDYEVMGIQQ